MINKYIRSSHAGDTYHIFHADQHLLMSKALPCEEVMLVVNAMPPVLFNQFNQLS